MRAVLLAVLLAALTLLVIVSSADARHRHRRHGFHDFRYSDARGEPTDAEQGAGRRTPAGLLPRDWRLEPPDPNWNGKRFVSPDGEAWLAAYSSPAQRESNAAHMKALAFEKDTDVITYLSGERDRIVVSGVRGDRLFYRKAVLACRGTTWHHVAFEYPVARSRELQRFVAATAGAVDRTENEGCEDLAPAAERAVPEKPQATTGSQD